MVPGIEEQNVTTQSIAADLRRLRLYACFELCARTKHSDQQVFLPRFYAMSRAYQGMYEQSP